MERILVWYTCSDCRHRFKADPYFARCPKCYKKECSKDVVEEDTNENLS